jgi:hypothetical protein
MGEEFARGPGGARLRGFHPPQARPVQVQTGEELPHLGAIRFAGARAWPGSKKEAERDRQRSDVNAHAPVPSTRRPVRLRHCMDPAARIKQPP